MPEQSAASRAFERNTPQLVALDAFDAVVQSEFAIEKRIIRIQEFPQRQIVIKHVSEKRFRFRPHRGFQVVAVVLKKVC